MKTKVENGWHHICREPTTEELHFQRDGSILVKAIRNLRPNQHEAIIPEGSYGVIIAKMIGIDLMCIDWFGFDVWWHTSREVENCGNDCGASECLNCKQRFLCYSNR